MSETLRRCDQCMKGVACCYCNSVLYPAHLATPCPKFYSIGMFQCTGNSTDEHCSDILNINFVDLHIFTPEQRVS